MDLGSIFLLLALLMLVVLFISRPFFERKKAVVAVDDDPQDHQRSVLLAERDRILNSIQELDFDHAMGKISEDEYPEDRALLVHSGVQVLKQLDAIDEGATDEHIDVRLEAALAARRADAAHSEDQTAESQTGIAETPGAEPSPSPAIDPDDELEVLLANRRRERREKSAGFCPQCGGALRQSDHFCPKCGASLG